MKKKTFEQSDPFPFRLIRKEDKKNPGHSRWSLFRFNDPSDDAGYTAMQDTFSSRAVDPFREKKRILRRILREEGIQSDAVTPARWFASAILGEFAAQERALEIGDAHGAAAAAYRAGYLDRMAFDKFKDEENVLLGTQGRRSRREGGKNTGERTATAAQKRNAAVLAENERLLPNHASERERAAIIARKIKRPVNTIRDILKRSK